MDLTKAMNNKRLPLAEQQKLSKGDIWSGRLEDTEQMGWLYRPDLEDAVLKGIEGQKCCDFGRQHNSARQPWIR